MSVVARQLWATSGLGPDDMQAAILYDHFTPYVLYQLEELGFCAKGEAKDFVADGRIELGGALPINTHGGQLGEAYLHGMNGIAEGVRQVRGTSVNQIAETLHLSPSTIGTHLYNIKHKLAVSNQSELTLIAVRQGLIET